MRKYQKSRFILLILDVNCRSNHPPAVLRNIPLGVNRRLSKNSANKEVFEAAIPVVQEGLDKSGYSHKLEYQPPVQNCTKKKNRRRPCIWFNPPFSKTVKTNIGKIFLKLIDSSFQPDNPLRKLFTRQTVKVSYRCMPNMAQAMARHNSGVLRDRQEEHDQQHQCNCRAGPAACPVQGKCKTDCVVYRATVTETQTGKVETYTGGTAQTFK